MRTTLYACASFFAGCISVAGAISGVALMTGYPLSEAGAGLTMVAALVGGYFALCVFGEGQR